MVTFEADHAVPERYAAIENLRGIAKRMGSTFTVEQFLAMGREDLELEERLATFRGDAAHDA